MNSIKTSLLATLALGNLFLAACSDTTPHVGETTTQIETADGVKLTQTDDRRLLDSGKIAGSESLLVEAESTVDKINYKNRKITLSSNGAEKTELVAGPEIRNFKQIKKGDKVKVEYLFSVAFEVRKPTAEELAAQDTTQEVLARAKLGEMPAAGAAQGRVRIATVQGIDKENGTITLTGIAANKSSQVKAKYPENLSYVKVGDTVVLTIVEAVATNVERIK